MAKHYDKQFKEDALQYRKDHTDLTVVAVCRNLGISAPTFYNWQNQAMQNDGEVESRIFVKGVLNELKASTSGYYDWKKRKPSNQTKRDIF